MRFYDSGRPAAEIPPNCPTAKGRTGLERTHTMRLNSSQGSLENRSGHKSITTSAPQFQHHISNVDSRRADSTGAGFAAAHGWPPGRDQLFPLAFYRALSRYMRILGCILAAEAGIPILPLPGGAEMEWIFFKIFPTPPLRRYCSALGDANRVFHVHVVHPICYRNRPPPADAELHRAAYGNLQRIRLPQHGKQGFMDSYHCFAAMRSRYFTLSSFVTELFPVL